VHEIELLEGIPIACLGAFDEPADFRRSWCFFRHEGGLPYALAPKPM
jgi:hypothetical protein